MHGDGEERLQELFDKDPELKKEYNVSNKLKNDPRNVTAIGKIDRKTSLDELPQLINFVKVKLHSSDRVPFHANVNALVTNKELSRA